MIMDDIIGIMICRICIWIEQTSWTPCDCADPKSICFVSVSISKARSHDAERGIRSWRVTQLGLVHLNYLQHSPTISNWIWSGLNWIFLESPSAQGRFRLGLWRLCSATGNIPRHPRRLLEALNLFRNILLTAGSPAILLGSFWADEATFHSCRCGPPKNSCSMLQLQVQSSMMIKNGPPGSQGIAIFLPNSHFTLWWKPSTWKELQCDRRRYSSSSRLRVSTKNGLQIGVGVSSV